VCHYPKLLCIEIISHIFPARIHSRNMQELFTRRRAIAQPATSNALSLLNQAIGNKLRQSFLRALWSGDLVCNASHMFDDGFQVGF
jgi:hypothetical protein